MSIKGGITTGSVSCVVKATGLSRATVVQIVQDGRWLAEGGQFPTPTKFYHGSRKYCNITDKEYHGSGSFTGYTIKALPVLQCQSFLCHHYNCDVTMSCDNQVAFLSFIASRVVAVVVVYGLHWLAWLLKVCNYQLQVQYWSDATYKANAF